MHVEGESQSFCFGFAEPASPNVLAQQVPVSQLGLSLAELGDCLPFQPSGQALDGGLVLGVGLLRPHINRFEPPVPGAGEQRRKGAIIGILLACPQDRQGLVGGLPCFPVLAAAVGGSVRLGPLSNSLPTLTPKSGTRSGNFCLLAESRHHWRCVEPTRIATNGLAFNDTSCRSEHLSQWRDTLHDLFFVGFFAADPAQVFNVLHKVVVWVRH